MTNLPHRYLSNWLIKARCSYRTTANVSAIEDTSDTHWSLDLQKNWPPFIMGVDPLWRGLIHESLQDSAENFADIHKLLGKYREVDARTAKIWRIEGPNALLHHMNAVFGYKPLIIRKELSF